MFFIFAGELGGVTLGIATLLGILQDVNSHLVLSGILLYAVAACVVINIYCMPKGKKEKMLEKLKTWCKSLRQKLCQKHCPVPLPHVHDFALIDSTPLTVHFDDFGHTAVWMTKCKTCGAITGINFDLAYKRSWDFRAAIDEYAKENNVEIIFENTEVKQMEPATVD